MNPSLLADRYARAIGAAAQDSAALEEAAKTIRAFCDLCQSDERLRYALSNPVLNPERRVQVAMIALDALEASPLVKRFVELLLLRNRVGLLPDIVRRIDDHAAEWLNRVVTTVVTAEPLADAQRARLQESLDRFTGKTVIMKTEVDPDLIGGLVVYMWGMFFDFSMRTRLEDLKRKLLTEVELTYES